METHRYIQSSSHQRTAPPSDASHPVTGVTVMSSLCVTGVTVHIRSLLLSSSLSSNCRLPRGVREPIQPVRDAGDVVLHRLLNPYNCSGLHSSSSSQTSSG